MKHIHGAGVLGENYEDDVTAQIPYCLYRKHILSLKKGKRRSCHTAHKCLDNLEGWGSPADEDQLPTASPEH